MKRLLLFSDIDRQNSFSKVSENIIHRLNELYDLTLLIPSTNVLKGNVDFSDYNVIHVGDHTDDTDLQSFAFSMKKSIMDLTVQTQYIVLQLVSQLQKGYDYLLIINSITEVKFILRLLHKMKHLFTTRIIVYTPFDYHYPFGIKELEYADTVLTPTKGVKDTLYCPHGNDLLVYYPIPIGVARERVSKLLGLRPFTNDEVIILNANRNIPRKNLEATIECAFRVNKIRSVKITFWIHTNYSKDLWRMIAEKAKKYSIATSECFIFTESGKSEETMNLVYNACQYSINTSNGEGWGLSTFEHGVVGGVPIVSDAMAMKDHFQEIGYCIPTVVERCQVEGETVECKKIDTEALIKVVETLRVDEDYYRRQKAMRVYTKGFAWEKTLNIICSVLE